MINNLPKRIQSEGLLFEVVQELGIFEDSKAFPDSIPLESDEAIQGKTQDCVSQCSQLLQKLQSGEEKRPREALNQLQELGARLKSIIMDCFELPAAPPSRAARSASMEEHIERMWEVLTRRSVDAPPRGTLLRLKHPYVVPGGRYAEFYYWDSYFVSVGLLACGRVDLLQHIVDNIADLIMTHGFMPNGTRSYYLSRSQAPYFSLMLGLLARAKGQSCAEAYGPVLKKEYEFWMSGERALPFGRDRILNRYWDDLPRPRAEGYREDRNTWHAAKAAGLRSDEEGLYRDIRAATESGWDFSSRWLRQDARGKWPLAAIRTTSIVPIDLNCLIYAMERQLGLWLKGEESRDFFARAARRRDALNRAPFWNERLGWYYDAETAPHGGEAASTGVDSLAGVFPLFCGVAEPAQAAKAAARLEGVFLRAGGLVTSPEQSCSGQQWDFPNGWAPLQWAAVAGLQNYGHTVLAREIAKRFTSLVRSIYDSSGKIMEKYDVCDLTREGGGGEYPNQDGFGWTNGVTAALIEYLKDGSAKG